MTASRTAITAVPITELGKEYAVIEEQLAPVLQQIFTSGAYILGKELQSFEQELAAYCQTRCAVGVASGTDAILLALRALGIGPGDEVIVPAMSFFATVEPVLHLAARPVFADITPDTYGLDPVQVKKCLTPRTRAIIAVHLYGLMADMKPLLQIAGDANISLMEDMAQAIGCQYAGRKAGSFGSIACLSFYPTKNLGACGDGGAVLTASEALASKVQSLRNHGARVKYQHDEAGFTSRLDEIQAAILRLKLKHLDAWNTRRRALAARYSEGLRDLPLVLPVEPPGYFHTYHLYTIRTPQRSELKSYLDSQHIATGVHYPTTLPLQSALKSLGHQPGEFPVSEALAREALSLPLYPMMSMEQADYVIEAVQNFFRRT